MAGDQPTLDEWSLEDLIERRSDAEIAWPSAEERAAAAERAEQRRIEMAGHADPGWMMFPSIADDGRVIPTSLHEEHGGHEHSHVEDHEDQEERGNDGDPEDDERARS